MSRTESNYIVRSGHVPAPSKLATDQPPTAPAIEIPTYSALVLRATASVPASPASRRIRAFIGGLKPHPAKPWTALPPLDRQQQRPSTRTPRPTYGPHPTGR